MNKSESKYFNTAARMDEAFLSLLEKKDFEYITVKELCEKAGVNRSTFYLHYETIGDLLTECIQYLNEQFLAHMRPGKDALVAKLHDCPLRELYLVTPEYLTPYLEYIREHKRLFSAAVRKPAVFRAEDTYDRMLRHVFMPILERFRVPEQDREYMMAFYVHGLMAVITQWLKGDCADSIDHVISVMQRCVMQHEETEEDV
ncbi:MAG: TetR/AcrR family transcriptional regulator [Oscillospiraceae bacterium]